MTRRGTLFIFVKPPRMGVAKTRLARGLGRTEARRIAQFTFERTARAVHGSSLNIVLAIAPDHAARAPYWPQGFARFPQGRGDLTARLTRAFDAAPMGPVYFIGADAPDISPAHLRAARRVLARHDAVIGPASDGGFWLFGLNKGPRTRAPFDGVRWSGPHTLSDLTARLPREWRVARLPTLTDIDEAEDWRAWRQANFTGMNRDCS